MEKTIASVCGVTNLMAKEGHQWPPLWAGPNSLKMNLGEEDVKRRLDEFFDGEVVILLRGDSQNRTEGKGRGAGKIIWEFARFPLTLLKEVVYCAA